MDGLQLLKNDHKRILFIINELINELTGKVKHTDEENGDQRPEMFGKLREILTEHLDIEERTLFRNLKGFVDTNMLVDECYEEHLRIDETLKKIEKLPQETQRAGCADLLAELERRVETYVVREEDWLFPKAKLLLGDAKLEKMFFEIEQTRSNQSEIDSLIFPSDRFGVGYK
jgi:iron-sulfur cluster repair protein YtfE (RIC family)